MDGADCSRTSACTIDEAAAAATTTGTETGGTGVALAGASAAAGRSVPAGCFNRGSGIAALTPKGVACAGTAGVSRTFASDPPGPEPPSPGRLVLRDGSSPTLPGPCGSLLRNA